MVTQLALPGTVIIHTGMRYPQQTSLVRVQLAKLGFQWVSSHFRTILEGHAGDPLVTRVHGYYVLPWLHVKFL